MTVLMDMLEIGVVSFVAAVIIVRIIVVNFMEYKSGN